MSESIPLYSLYGQIETAAELNFIHLESIKSRNRLYDWHIKPHRHTDLHQLIWIHDGHGKVFIDQHAYQLHSPVLLSIPAPIVHGFQWVPETQGLVFTISDIYLSNLLNNFFHEDTDSLIQQLHIIKGAIDAAKFKNIALAFNHILEEYISSKPYRNVSISNNIVNIFIEMARNLPTNSQNKSTDKEAVKNYRKFKQMVEAHYKDQLRVEEYAAKMAISERSLRRLCENQVGMTPSQVIQRRIILEAERNLLYTDRNIAEIAYALGFIDPAYFTRFFTKHKLVSPEEFRQIRRN